MSNNNYLFVSSDVPFEAFDGMTILNPDELQSRLLDEEPFIVSNVPTDHAYILADEVNWLLESPAHTTQYEQKLQILYGARLACFDYMQSEHIRDVKPSLFVLGDGQVAQDFCLFANQNGFDAVLLEPSCVVSIGGGLGEFNIQFTNNEPRVYAQGVLFVDIPALQLYHGIESAGDFDNPTDLLNALKQRLGDYSYRDILHFDPTYCQYENRREKCCGACAQACPTFGIYADDSKKTLRFSAIDCIECGACLSVCPTAAIEFAEFPNALFLQIIRMYKGYKICLLDKQSFAEVRDSKLLLPADVLPLIIPEINALSPLLLLSCIQENGSSIAIYKSTPLDSVLNAIEIVNDIIARGYNNACGIHLLTTPQDWQMLATLESIPNVGYFYSPRENEHSRKSFAERLRFVVKGQDLGVIPSYPSFRYGQISLKEGCTLCLSCVGACNVGALSANEHNFTLLFDPSVCTTCEYCLLSCPENVMQLERSGIELNAQWFVSKVLAKDTPFCCVECGKPFATTRSVAKIRDMLMPKFGADERKIRTLECCPDCKVRVMAAGMIEDSSKF